MAKYLIKSARLVTSLIATCGATDKATSQYPFTFFVLFLAAGGTLAEKPFSCVLHKFSYLQISQIRVHGFPLLPWCLRVVVGLYKRSTLMQWLFFRVSRGIAHGIFVKVRFDVYTMISKAWFSKNPNYWRHLVILRPVAVHSKRAFFLLFI